MNLRRVGAGIGAALLALTMAACSTGNTDSDQVGLHYEGGPVSSAKFANCMGASTKNFDGPGDSHYIYPAGQRTYDFSTDKNADHGVIKVNTMDGVELKVSGAVTFELNTDCAKLRKFHEQVGGKYSAYLEGEGTDVPEGWDRMLDVYMGQALQRSMSNATQGLNWKPLYSDPKTKVQWEQEVIKGIPATVKALAGDNFFENFSIVIQKPDLPDALQGQLQAEQVAIQARQAQVQENARLREELNGFNSLVAKLGREGAIDYLRVKVMEEAIKSGKVQVIYLPDGTSVSAAPK